LKLPMASKHQKDPPHKAKYISVQADGNLYVDREPVKFDDLLSYLINKRMDDPELSVIIRGDGKTKYKKIRAVLDLCQQANLAKVDLATEVNK